MLYIYMLMPHLCCDRPLNFGSMLNHSGLRRGQRHGTAICNPRANQVAKAKVLATPKANASAKGKAKANAIAIAIVIAIG